MKLVILMAVLQRYTSLVFGKYVFVYSKSNSKLCLYYVESNCLHFAAFMQRLCGTLARMHISITTDRWTNADLDSGKEKIWTDIKVPYMD